MADSVFIRSVTVIRCTRQRKFTGHVTSWNVVSVGAAPGLLDSRTFPRMQVIVHLFIFVVFLNRYVFGLYLTMLRGKKMDPKITGFEPTITVVIPLFNEGPSTNSIAR